MSKDDSLCVGPSSSSSYTETIGMCCVGGGGTFAYMAPERIIYDVRYPQSDIWSLGATMYTLLTGKIIWGARDFDKATIDIIKVAILLEQPEEIDSGILLLDSLINGMTKKDVTQRITTDKIMFMLRDV